MAIPANIVHSIEEFKKSKYCPDCFKKESVEFLLKLFSSMSAGSNSGNHCHLLPYHVPARAVSNSNAKHR